MRFSKHTPLHFVVFLFLLLLYPAEVPVGPPPLGELPTAAELAAFDFFFLVGLAGECPMRWPAADAFPPEALKDGRSSWALKA